MKTPAVLTFDLEFWHNSQFLKKQLSPDFAEINDQTEQIINRLLAILKQAGQLATFFILGQLADKYPAVIRQIANEGHEIACHGYSHKTLKELGRDNFKREIKQNQAILTDSLYKNLDLPNHNQVIGFRAPNFSLTKKTSWALDILRENNFQYDASFHPLKISWLKKQIKTEPKIKEIFTALGGIYFRVLPLWLYCWLVKGPFKNQLPVLYFHPHELFAFTPRIKTGSWLKRTIKYWGTRSAEKKFIKLMEKFHFISLKQYLYENTAD